MFLANDNTQIMEMLSGEVTLRSKRELIEKFINENLPHMRSGYVEEEFEQHWQKEQDNAFAKLCTTNN